MHRLFFNRSVATGKPGRPGPRDEPSQKIRHGGCVLLAKDERDGCNIRAFFAQRIVPLDSARERAEFFWIFARWVRKGNLAFPSGEGGARSATDEVIGCNGSCKSYVKGPHPPPAAVPPPKRGGQEERHFRNKTSYSSREG